MRAMCWREWRIRAPASFSPSGKTRPEGRMRGFAKNLPRCVVVMRGYRRAPLTPAIAGPLPGWGEGEKALALTPFSRAREGARRADEGGDTILAGDASPASPRGEARCAGVGMEC